MALCVEKKMPRKKTLNRKSFLQLFHSVVRASIPMERAFCAMCSARTMRAPSEWTRLSEAKIICKANNDRRECFTEAFHGKAVIEENGNHATPSWF